MSCASRFLDSSALGIFGAGHFGRAVAAGLLEAGFPRCRLRVCHRGSADTRRKLARMGLSECVRDRHALVRDSTIVIYTVRPQDRQAIADCVLRPDGLLISFLAGVPLARLPVSLPEHQRVRVTASSPYTLRAKKGIAAMYPAQNASAQGILSALGLRVFTLEHEEQMDAFTAFCTCLPTALSYCEALGCPTESEELLTAAARHGLPDYAQVLAWARSVQAHSGDAVGLREYIRQAATPGGVTEAILREIESGRPLSVALESGVERSKALGSDSESQGSKQCLK